MNVSVVGVAVGILTSAPTIALAVLGETTFSVLVWAAVLCVLLVFGSLVRGLVDEWG